MKITFLGATSTVTGSKTHLEIEGLKLLIDAGLFQEGAEFSALNLAPLGFDPKSLDAVIITHAHLDHTGFLPLLFRQGFRGPIYLTRATAKLARIIIEDSAGLMEESPKPLYTQSDATGVTSLFHPMDFNETFAHKSINICFYRAGHILGASFVKISSSHKSLIFSGDLGRFDDPLLAPPDDLGECDALIMEATYGDRVRTHQNMLAHLLKLLEEVVLKHQTLLIPCFALHRAQLMAFLFYKLFKDFPHLKIPMAFNSPMMKDVTKVYLNFLNEFSADQKILKQEWQEMNFLDHFWDIERFNQTSGAKIIIASSGMVTGGRIWTHLKALAPRPDTVIFLPGFQSRATAGYELIHGAKSLLSPEGEVVTIRAEVKNSDAFSSHADQEDLLRWVKSSKSKPHHIYLIHGEDKAKAAFSQKLALENFNVRIVKKDESILL